MTPSMKPQYVNLKKKSGNDLEECYRKVDERKNKEE